MRVFLCVSLAMCTVLSDQLPAAEKQPAAAKHIGLGAKAAEGAEILIDGTRELLDAKWTYWKGPRFSSSLPIKWKLVDDPVDDGTVLVSSDPAAAGGKYGAADLVTKKKTASTVPRTL